MVLKLEDEGAVLEDAVVARPASGVALVLVHVVDALAVVKGRTEDVDCGFGGEGAVEEGLELVEDAIVRTVDAVGEDAT